MDPDDSPTETAFSRICKDAREVEPWYVCLVSSRQAYGGPEEGGWWYDVQHVHEYQSFPSEAIAKAVARHVRKLAAELTAEARRAYGDRCLREMEWCEDRGLDPDYLIEPDSPDEYSVIVTQGIPEYNARPQYC